MSTDYLDEVIDAPDRTWFTMTVDAAYGRQPGPVSANAATSWRQIGRLQSPYSVLLAQRGQSVALF
jgi:hypothetical protein